MKICVDLKVTFYDDVYSQPMSGGFTTHIINLANEDALERLIEYYKGDGLDAISLTQEDCIPYDIEKD